MAPLGIVVTDVLDDRLARLIPRLEAHVVDALDLQGAVDRFHRRVVPAIPFATHRHRDASRLELASIVLRSVLRPTVRVMQQARIGIAPPQCNVQRAQRQLLRHRLAHCPAYELAAYRSSTNARYSQPSLVGTYVMSANHFWFGAVASKSRPRTFGATGCACFESVVTTRKRRRLWLCSPCSRITRATRL